MMDADQRARLRALCEAATPGPWEAEHRGVVGNDVVVVEDCATAGWDVYPANQALIAAARTALPALLGALDAEERASREVQSTYVAEVTRLCVERDDARAEVDRLRRLLDDAMRTLYAAPGVHSSRTVAETIERALYPERFAVERATIDAGPRDGDGREVG